MRFGLLSLVVLSLSFGCAPEVIVESDPVEPNPSDDPPAPIEDPIVEYCDVGMYHRKCRRFDDSVGLCTVPGLCALPCESVDVCNEIVECHVPKCEDGTCAYYLAPNNMSCDVDKVCLNGVCQ